MNRIANTFKALQKRKEKALVGFVTAGDPDLIRSEKIITAMCEAGMDILELGVPFSDPTADGPVIQRSSARALAHGVNLNAVLNLAGRLRKKTAIPIIIFTYYNPIHALGINEFHKQAIAGGVDGVLVVDLPPEESDEMTGAWPDTQLDLIRLIAPTTPKERMSKIAKTASGFLYLVSKTGVTGSQGLNTSAVNINTESLRAVTDLPICVGFGISTAEQVAATAKTADGVVIGSAFERLIEENLDKPNLVNIIKQQTAEYKAATRKKE